MAQANPLFLQFTQIKKILLLLDQRDRFRLFLVLIVNTFLALLDLIGVALIGIATAILIRGLQSLEPGNQVSRFLELLNLDAIPQRNLLILLVFGAVFFFIAKTILSVYFLRRTLRYMSFRNAQISSSLVSKMLNTKFTLLFAPALAVTDAPVSITNLPVVTSAASLTGISKSFNMTKLVAFFTNVNRTDTGTDPMLVA
jgi:hypothetical protein